MAHHKHEYVPYTGNAKSYAQEREKHAQCAQCGMVMPRALLEQAGIAILRPEPQPLDVEQETKRLEAEEKHQAKMSVVLGQLEAYAKHDLPQNAADTLSVIQALISTLALCPDAEQAFASLVKAERDEIEQTMAEDAEKEAGWDASR